jgi:hypothetical protein
VLDDLERAQRALDAVRVRFTAAVAASGVTDERFGHRSTPWLAIRHGGPVGARKRDLQTARVLTRFPVLDQAVQDGKIPMSRVEAIVRVTSPGNLDALTASQHELLDLSAATARFRQFVDDIEALAAHADQDGTEPEDEPADRVAMSRTGDELHVRGCFHGPAGVELESFLNASADRLFHRHRGDAAACPADLPVPDRDALLAGALSDLVARGVTADVTVTQSPKTGVTLTLTEPDPLRPWETVPVWGTPRRVLGIRSLRLTHRTIEYLCCDPVLDAFLVDRDGNPVAGFDLDRHGHGNRRPSREQRRAAAHRDGGCVFPGCGAHVGWTDLHHVVHWNDDGPTILANLASLCRHHHGVVHRNGWSMTADGDGWFTITTPSGLVLRSQRHGRPKPAPA